MYLTTKIHFMGGGVNNKSIELVIYRLQDLHMIPHNCKLVHMTITSRTTQSQAVHILQQHITKTPAQAVYLTIILSTRGRSYFLEV